MQFAFVPVPLSGATHPPKYPAEGRGRAGGEKLVQGRSQPWPAPRPSDLAIFPQASSPGHPQAEVEIWGTVARRARDGSSLPHRHHTPSLSSSKGTGCQQSWAELFSVSVSFPQGPSPDLRTHVVVCLLFSKRPAKVGSQRSSPPNPAFSPSQVTSYQYKLVCGYRAPQIGLNSVSAEADLNEGQVKGQTRWGACSGPPSKENVLRSL